MTKSIKKLCAPLSMLPLILSCHAAPADGPSPKVPVATGAAEQLVPIKKVEIGANREFRVNGQPYFPIMGWLQAPANLPKLKAVGINTITGYWWEEAKGVGAGGTKSVAIYGEAARDAGLYFVSPYLDKHPESMQTLKASPNLLAWIHDDEPDLPRTSSDADVTGPGLIINGGAPLRNMVDGITTNMAVVDPLADAQFTIKLKQAVTVKSLAVTPYVDTGIPSAKEVSISGDGKEILSASLENKKGKQTFELATPATFSTLTVKVQSVYPSPKKFGAFAEIEAYDAAGVNVLLSPARKGPQHTPQEAMAHYQAIKGFDPARPVLMTVTGFFIKDDIMRTWYSKEQADQMYPEFFKAADVPGFDIYPIYGWNLPDKLNWVSQGVREMRAYEGGKKPIFAWIEVQHGGQFGANAKPVTGVEIRHEVWQAIISGATAIGYFTHQFKPAFSEFGPPEENQKALLEINQQLQRLAPAILSADAAVQPTIALEGGLAAQLLAKQHGGSLYVFAQNMDMARGGAQATVTVNALKAGATIEVVDENRTLIAEKGRFTDTFAPLAVHIYKIKMPK